MSEIKAEDYIGLMKKQAASFHKTTGLPFEDLLSNAHLAFVYAKATYDPNKSKFSTYLHNTCKTILIDYCKGQHPHYLHETNNQEEIDVNIGGQNHQTPETQLLFKEAVNNLGFEARTICQMIFESPHEFLSMNRPKFSRGHLRTKLRTKGWTWEMIWDGFREIKEFLNETT